MIIRVMLFAVLFNSVSLSQNFQIRSFFPEHHSVEAFTADAMYHRMAVATLFDHNRTIATIGSVIPVFDLFIYSIPVQLSIAGSSHIELEPDERANLVTSDFYVDYCLADLTLKDDAWLRIGAGHSSHHYSDNWYEFLKETKSLIYSKDYVQLYYVKKFSTIPMIVYFGATYSYYFIINHETFHPWTPQIGIDVDVKKYSDQVSLYTAFDFKLRQEVNYASTQNFQFGVRWKNKGRTSARFAYQFRNGIDERGQLYANHRLFHSLGIFIDL